MNPELYFWTTLLVISIGLGVWYYKADTDDDNNSGATPA